VTTVDSSSCPSSTHNDVAFSLTIERCNPDLARPVRTTTQPFAEQPGLEAAFIVFLGRAVLPIHSHKAICAPAGSLAGFRYCTQRFFCSPRRRRSCCIPAKKLRRRDRRRHLRCRRQFRDPAEIRPSVPQTFRICLSSQTSSAKRLRRLPRCSNWQGGRHSAHCNLLQRERLWACAQRNEIQQSSSTAENALNRSFPRTIQVNDPLQKIQNSVAARVRPFFSTETFSPSNGPTYSESDIPEVNAPAILVVPAGRIDAKFALRPR